MREGAARHFRDFSNPDKPANKRSEDYDPEDTMIYEPGQEETLLAKEARTQENQKANTQFNIIPQFGEDLEQFGENPTMLKTGRTIYEKANEGSVEEARDTIIYYGFYKALGMNTDDMKEDENVIKVDFDKKLIRKKEPQINFDRIDPILAGVHLAQAKEFGFDNYEQMRDDFMEVMAKAIKFNKLSELPRDKSPLKEGELEIERKSPKEEAENYLFDLEKDIIEELDEQISVAGEGNHGEEGGQIAA